ncbi:50S ribosomal protein L30e [Candidatus Bathyarchaeota archaeon]|nr:MAG: 50S ribosomal protein L30e [Candidatus Bathyarchaeota archaeon]RLI19391.1 MAG: 50S ribosomal protein L30e [Candidatus Bathyarchaeota archaeon]
MSSLDHELRMALKTGRFHLGSKSALKELLKGRAKLIILSSNCPEHYRRQIEEYAKLAGVPILRHRKDSIDLGTLCGKPFPVSAIVINEPGDSKILSLVKGGDA